MRVGIYPQSLYVYGGGEKYIGKIAEILSTENNVEFIVTEIKTEYGRMGKLYRVGESDFGQMKSRFNIDLSRVSINKIRDFDSLLPKNMPRLAKWISSKVSEEIKEIIDDYMVSRCTREYDLFINQEHVTFIRPHSRRSILVCEVPPVKRPIHYKTLSRLLLDLTGKTYDTIVVNSHFTKKWAEKYYRKKATILYPPIDTQSFVPSAKEHIILSVGRFSTVLHSKKQLEMIRTFKKLYTNQELKGWEYHLVGALGGDPNDKEYFSECKKESEGYPVCFHVNAPFDVLKELYGKSKTFWHATGLGENESSHPELMEHFGMTTVEAMSAGCVPVVINKGGQPEIVKDESNGFLFENEKELAEYTLRLLKDEALWRKMSESCIRRSQEFSLEYFELRLKEILQLS